MRLAFAASALCLGALGLGLLALGDQPATPRPPASTAPAPASTAPAPASTAPAAAPTTPASAATVAAAAPSTVAGDAAARHVKRTGCLKDAKARKLIGAEKATFLKTCIDAPAEPISASRHRLPDRP